MVSLKGILPTKNDLALAAGAAVSGTITGLVAPMIPMNLEFFPGTTEFLIGLGLKKFLLKKGIGAEFAKGVMVAGLSHIIAGFIPQFAGTIGPKRGQMRYQQDGTPHAQWFAQRGPGIYIHRNPVFGTHTETLRAPAGTRYLKDRVPRIAMDSV